MNKLDKQYTDLLQDILDNGVVKDDRTGTGTKSVFGRQLRHKMSDGFPLLTTKKMPFKSIVTELLWFLNGDTNIKYLVDNGCNIWNGDTYKAYAISHIKETRSQQKKMQKDWETITLEPHYLNQSDFIDKIKADEEFAKKWGDLGPIYGKQWRKWQGWMDMPNAGMHAKGSLWYDQISRLIHQLKTNPDSRRLMVNAWNVGELDQMVLPPCHYGFQVYTRLLSDEERSNWWFTNITPVNKDGSVSHAEGTPDFSIIPTRAISLMWNQRSVDTFLGLPFNIASYGLLLTILGKIVNMVPDELICNLGDTHLYLNHLEQAKEQIGVDLVVSERIKLRPDYLTDFNPDEYPAEGCLCHGDVTTGHDYLKSAQLARPDDEFNYYFSQSIILDFLKVPKRSREPFKLPTIDIDTTDWLAMNDVFDFDKFMKSIKREDFKLNNYKSHSEIKAPLSN